MQEDVYKLIKQESYIRDRFKLVAVSMYANCLHPGHIDLIRYAAIYGGVIVIINNDNQVKLKGSIPFQSQEIRAEIVDNIGWVKYTVISVDQDESVAKTLDLLKPRIFINAGDRFAPNHKEQEVCAKNNIPMMFCPHLPKRYSSSEFIKNAINYYNSHNQ